MATNLIDLVRQYIPDEAIGKISGLLGESGASTQKAVEAGIPTLLAGLLHTASTPSGAGRLANMVGGEEGAKASDILSNIGGLLGGQADEPLKFGQQIVSSLFGSNLSSVLDVLSKFSGMKLASIGPLMGMLAPLVLGVLRKQTASQGFSASSLIGLLTSQKDAIVRQAPAGLAGALGLNSLTNLGVESEAIRHPAARAAEYGSEAVRRTAEAVEQRTSWLKWALPLGLLGLLGCILAYFLSGKREPAVQTAKVNLPGGASLDVQEGSALDGIVKYVEDPSGSRPNKFVFEGLGFNANNAVSFSPEATARIGTLATILKAFPAARLKIEGHTDDVGDPATNRRLSLDRADAIERLLVRAGVPAERITTEGVGPDRPIATNDTEDGRAKNRRIELAIMVK
jgi:OmpA-OmpF porin, OOP family